MEEATHVAWVLVLAETCSRLSYVSYQDVKFDYECTLAVAFALSYALCIATVLLEVKRVPFFRLPLVKDAITVLHALDGVNALLIGLGMFYHNVIVVTVGLLCMTKLFLLHLLSRMVTGVQTYSTWSVVLQTTKTFLHHTGSFLFIASSDYEVMLITAIWRFISMNGHAAMTLKKHISPEWYEWLMWKISHLRNAALAGVLLLCWSSDRVRDGFAYSACGHLAYLLVRMGPVFRIGSLYFPSPEALGRWAKLSDAQRLRELLSLKHPYFALELGILLVATLYLAGLRVWWLLYRQQHQGFQLLQGAALQ